MQSAQFCSTLIRFCGTHPLCTSWGWYSAHPSLNGARQGTTWACSTSDAAGHHPLLAAHQLHQAVTIFILIPSRLQLHVTSPLSIHSHIYFPLEDTPLPLLVYQNTTSSFHSRLSLDRTCFYSSTTTDSWDQCRRFVEPTPSATSHNTPKQRWSTGHINSALPATSRSTRTPPTAPKPAVLQNSRGHPCRARKPAHQA